jgi:hypothetical protein
MFEQQITAGLLDIAHHVIFFRNGRSSLSRECYEAHELVV